MTYGDDDAHVCACMWGLRREAAEFNFLKKRQQRKKTNTPEFFIQKYSQKADDRKYNFIKTWMRRSILTFGLRKLA